MGRTFLRRLADSMDLASEPLPGQTVTELWADSRVLIENHRGILCYSPQVIRIQVDFGILEVTGESLELTHMTADTLIISGSIRGLTPRRREPS